MTRLSRILHEGYGLRVLIEVWLLHCRVAVQSSGVGSAVAQRLALDVPLPLILRVIVTESENE
jgi:hypothetical protein